DVFERFRENYRRTPETASPQQTLGFRQNTRKLVKFSGAVRSQATADLELNRALVTGEKVVHEKFGSGTILDLQGPWPETKALIDFGPSGRKSLLLKFARLKKAV